MFLAYIADLSVHINTKDTFYADDCKFYANVFSDHIILQLDLGSVERWCVDWLIPLNADKKCVLLCFGRRSLPRAEAGRTYAFQVVGHHTELLRSELMKLANRTYPFFQKLSI